MCPNDQADKASSGAASTVAFERHYWLYSFVGECGLHGDKFNAVRSDKVAFHRLVVGENRERVKQIVNYEQNK